MKIEQDHSQIEVGDILEYRCPVLGIVWQWRVQGIYLGVLKQEGLVEVVPIFHRAGSDAAGEYNPAMVPEPMTRNLTLIKPGAPEGQDDG